MALLRFPLPSSIGCFTTTRLLPSYPKSSVISCMAKGPTVADDQSSIRRSANYQPPIWRHEFVQSLTSEFKEETYLSQIDKLKKAVKMILADKKMDEEPLKKLELIDAVQRLGLSYHFETEIKRILEEIYLRFNEKANMRWINNKLYATALEFRILRQHGYYIPQDVFNDFKEEITNFNASCGEEKAKVMLSLYEASCLAIEDESLLDEMRNFSYKHLLNYIKSSSNDTIIYVMVSHALQLPLHWRMPRLEARWFIDIYERKADMNPNLLEFAKLDFNLVQSTHQEELKYVSSWWRSLGLGENLGFARDRLMSNFFWTVGLGFEPDLGYCRRMSTKITSLITVIDDVYDVYGTLEELELFTNAVERWDVNAIDSLPDYMKVCFLALHNTINDMAFDTLKDQGVNVIQYLKKMWADLCKTFLIEAKWYYTNYKPTFNEYLENAWISVSGPLILVHAYVFASTSITKEALESLIQYPEIIRHSSIIFRLANDLATSSDEVKRGDVSKSLQCYMNETDASEDEARLYIQDLIIESWKKLNELQASNSSSYLFKAFTEISLNLARISHTVYQHRDGHTVEDQETKDRVLSLFLKSI